MVIEFSNTKNTSHRSLAAPFLVFLAAIFFLFPVILVLVGIYSQNPTGTLISPIPEAVISQEPSLTPTINSALVAADQVATPSSILPVANSNSAEKHTTLPANQSEALVTDSEITEDSQIFLLPNSTDSAVYFVKSKQAGSFSYASTTVSATDRSLDYQIVNP